MYSIKLRAETITQNVKLTDTIYGGWFAQNIGSAPVTVYGIPLLPGEGINAMDWVADGNLWTEPIDITVQAGGAVRLLRKLYKPITDEPIGKSKKGLKK